MSLTLIYFIIILSYGCGLIVRDGTLTYLAELLNNSSNVGLYRGYVGSKEDFVNFIKILKPWISADIPMPLLSTFRTDYVGHTIDCTQDRYANALSGIRLPSPRIVVDFVPFGYDFDMLHIRLHETYHAVDAFVLYEATRTQSGLAKPLYFSDIMNSSRRFVPYLDKIIYVSATDNDLRPYLEKLENYNNFASHQKGHTKKNHDNKWALEDSMRIEVIRKFKAMAPGTNAARDKIIRAVENDDRLAKTVAWGLQNDADELITGEVVKLAS